MRAAIDKLLNSRRNLRPETAMLCGVLLAAALGSESVSGIFVAVLIAVYVILFKIKSVLFALFSGVVATLFLWFSAPPSELSNNGVFDDYTIQVTDRRICHGCGLNPIMYVDSKFHNLFSNTAVKVLFPKDLEPEYGGVYQLSGYLSCRHGKLLIFAEKSEKIATETDFFTPLILLRERWLRRTLSGIDDQDLRSGIAALVFNAGGGVSCELKQKFLLSGTVHLFCVSGLHVGIVVFIFLWLLRPIPFSWRYITVTIIAGIYIFLSGAAVPAIRAWLLVFFFFWFRATIYWVPTMRILICVATAMLMFFPRLSYDIGTQYTFLVTASLLFATNLINRHFAAEKYGTIRLFRENPSWQRVFRCRFRFTMIFGGVLMAYLGGAGVSFAVGGKLLPAALVANLFIAPLMTILFIFPALTACTGYGAYFAKLSLGFMEKVSGISAWALEPFPAIRPATEEIIIYYLAFFACLICKNRKIKIVSAAVFFLLFLSWIFRFSFADSAVLVSRPRGFSDPPVVALYDAERKFAAVINLDDDEGAEIVVDFLSRHGVRRLNLLATTVKRRKPSRGVNVLTNSYFPMRQVGINDENSLLSLRAIDGGYELRYHFIGSEMPFILRVIRSDGGVKCDWNTPRSESRILPWRATSREALLISP